MSAPYPGPNLSAATGELQRLLKHYESHERNSSPVVVRAAHAAFEDVEAYGRTMQTLEGQASKVVDDKLARALRTSFRDVIGRTGTTMARELDKVSSNLIDEVRFVFEADALDDPHSGEEAIESLRQSLAEQVAKMDIAGQLEATLNEFMATRFRETAFQLYTDLLHSLDSVADDTLTARVQGVNAKLNIMPSNDTPLPIPPKPVPRPQTGTSSYGRPPSQVSPVGHAPMPNVPQRPAQKPASQSSVPAPDTPQSRAPPVVRPKPKALSTEGPSETVAPLAAEKSPIARSQVSLADVGGQMSDIGSDEHDQEPPKPNVRPELNRMLSGPPPRAVRSVPRPMSQVDMDRVHAEAGDVSNPASPVRSSPSRRGTIATYSQPLDDSEYDYVEDAPSASEVTSHAQEEPIVQPAVPPRPSQPTTTGDPVDAEIVQGSDEHGKSVKEKQKAMKSPKMGIRGMLSHLTKSRPKKGKKGAKEDDEDLEEADTHGPGPVMADPNAAPEEHFDDQPVEQISSVPPASDPVESADYDHVPSHLKEKSLASGRSSRHTHSRPGSNGSAAPFNVSQTTGVQNDAAGNTQHQNASVEDLRDDRDPNRPPSVPTRPKRPQNAAMSALASVMRGGNARPDESIDSDDAASVSSAKGSLASGAAVRTSIYSDSGDSEHFNERPLSQYSSHTQPGGAPSGRPQSQYSTGPGVGPRPASQYSTGQAHGGRPPSQYSMGQVSEAGTDRRSIHHDAREEVEPRGRGQVISPARKSMHEDSVSVSSSAPDDLPAVAPRRPPKPVQSNSPMRRSAADPGSPAGPPVIPQKPAVSRKSMHIEDGGPASPTSRKSLYMMDDVTPRSPTGSVPPPQHRPRPPPAAQDRPKSTFSSNSTGSAMHDSGSGHQEYTQETEEPVPAEVAASPRPRRIPGVFATNHGALGALAAAVTGRGAQAHTYDEPERESDGHQYDAPPSDVVVPGHHADQSNAPAEHPRSPPMTRSGQSASASQGDLFNGPGLALKRRESSTSGDDRAIEKAAMEWLNKNLESQNVHVDNLYSSLGNGLNLIYALEAQTGQSVGKYNKRAMLPVHKIDNIAVALNFLKKNGVNTGFCSPQDIMDGDRGKILTLFNYILKVFP